MRNFLGVLQPGVWGLWVMAAVMSMGRRIVGVIEGGVDPQRFIPRLIEYYRELRFPLKKRINIHNLVNIEQVCVAAAMRHAGSRLQQRDDRQPVR